MRADSVFISYSHNSISHADKVLALSNALRVLGVDTELDRYHTRPLQGWPHWCEEQLRPENSRFVLVICTPTYRDRVENKVNADEGRGVYWEGSIIYHYLYVSKSNTRFIPVLLGEESEESIPFPLRGHARYQIRRFELDDAQFGDLYRELTGQPAVIKPALGSKVVLSPVEMRIDKALPERAPRTDFSPFVERIRANHEGPPYPTLEPDVESVRKPIIFISYAQADEPEQPAEGEIKWLTFVTGYLRPAVKLGAAEFWIDQLMPGGVDWELEIERKLSACDIFVLLVSRHSLSSDYVIEKEIGLIRNRQARGEEVYFYPLLLTPTPAIALELLRDKNLRPRGGKPFSDYTLSERYHHMNHAANEIAAIADGLAKRRRTQLEFLPSKVLVESANKKTEPLATGNSLAKSSLRLSVGNDGPYSKSEGRGLYRFRRTLFLRIENIDLNHSIKGIRAKILSIEPQTEYVGPWTLAEQVDLAPGADVFIPLVSFGEPYINSAVGDRYHGSDTFFEVLTKSSAIPSLPRELAEIVMIKVTGFETAPCEFACKVWVERNDGRLKIDEIEGLVQIAVDRPARTFTTQTIQTLLGFYRGSLTGLQAAKLIEPFNGMWIRVEGNVTLLMPDGNGAVCVLTTGDPTARNNAELRFSSEWVTALSRLSNGDSVSAIGKIARYQNGSQLYLLECELSDG